jgi:AraC-like DNA-binding protein
VPIVAQPGRGPLAPFVRSIWLYRGEHDHALERILPSPALQLLVNLDEDALRAYRGEGWRSVSRIGGVGVVGLRSGPCAIDTREQRCIAGVAFRPGGAWPFLGGVPAHRLRDLEVDAGDLWGAFGRELRERCLEAASDRAVLAVVEEALLSRLGDAQPDEAMGVAVRRLARGDRVRDTGAAIGMAPATFRRRFAARVGTSPKRFARVARLHRTLEAANAGEGGCWAELAFAQGYADQSHLIRELRDLAGLTPSAYEPRDGAGPLHVIEE